MAHYAGFDIGGTNARLSLFDDSWQTLAQVRRSVRGASGPHQITEAMDDMLRQASEAADLTPADLASVGVGVAGQLNAAGTRVINAPNLGWRTVPFADLIADVLEADYGQQNVRIVNDLNALLWGEYQAGAVAGIDHVLAVYVGTGVGGAILTDGRLVHGSGGKGGEIGHTKVVPGGRLCGCGERGCVEAYTGGVHLETLAAEIAERHDIDAVGRSGDTSRAGLQQVDRLAADGHDDFNALWNTATDYLAVTLANACTLLNPAVLLLGGGILENLSNFRGRLLSKITPLVLHATRHDLDICFPNLGDEAGVLGAATLAAADRKEDTS